MSSTYRVEFQMVGNAGNIDSVLNRLNNGISRVGQNGRQTANQLGLIDRQLMAMGTTMRYAFAGGIVFGVTNALKALSQFQVQLGNIQTVATRPGGIQGLGNEINDLGQSLIRISNDTITPVNNLADAVTNLYSSISQDLPLSDVEKLTSIFSKTARTTQVTDVRALVGSLLGGVNAFGLPSGPGQIGTSVQTLADQFYKVLQRSINISGEEFAQQAGRLYSSARSAGLTPAQTGALVIQSSQFGGTAASIIQNLAQLLIYVRNPKTPGQKAAYAQAGVTDKELLNPNGGYEVIQKLISHAQRLGVRGTLGGRVLSSKEIRGLSDDDAKNLKLSGQGARFFAAAFGRIQSQRTLIALASESLPDLNKQVQDVANSAGDVNAGFKRFKDQAPLAELANSLHNLSLTAIQNASPLLNPLARGISGVTNAASRHPHVTAVVEGALFTALAGNALKRYLPGRLGKLVRGANVATGDVAAGAITAEQLPNILSGAAPDGSRANPYWVIISPVSQYIGVPGGVPGMGGGGTGLPPVVPGPGLLGRIARNPIGKGGLIVGGTLVTDALLRNLGWYKKAEDSLTWHDLLSPHGKPGLSGLQTQLAMGLQKSSPPLDPSMWRNIGQGDMSDVRKAMAAAHLTAAQVNKVQVEGDKKTGLVIRLLDRLGRSYTYGEGAGGVVPLSDSLSPLAEIQRRLAALQGHPGERMLNTENRREAQAARRAMSFAGVAGLPGHDVLGVEGNLKGDFTIYLVDKNGHEIGVQERKGVPVKLWQANTVPQHRGKPKDTRKGQT